MADLSDGVKAFVDQFRAQTDENVNRLGEFSVQLSDLAKRYNDAIHDLDRERVAARQMQERTTMLQSQFSELKEATMRGAFVLVLVDADADSYLFHDRHYTDDPGEGGERAAVDLKAAVQQYLRSVDSTLVGLPVVAKAFAFGEGLRTLLVKAGIAKGREDASQVLSRFTCGFSQVDDMFDFVLVGKGKDRADHKLMGAFRQFVESPSCRHILLACCHDNGYVRMLEKYVHTSAVVNKVTLVKSFQTGGEFGRLPFQHTTMDTVFRSSPIGHGAAVQVNGHAVTPVQSSSLPATYASRAAVSQPATPLAGLNRGPLPLFGTLDKNIILINADGHRIDMLLPPKSAAAAEAFSRKIHVDHMRFCNRHHLEGSCLGNCGYTHGQLSPGETLVMRHRLRREQCLNCGNCRDPSCLYGHCCACPGVKKCNFPAAMHGVDVACWREVNTSTASTGLKI